MKPKPFKLDPEVRSEQRLVLSLAIDSWDEESFSVPLRAANALFGDSNENLDDIEAVGAADDASRFRIDEPLEDTVGAYP